MKSPVRPPQLSWFSIFGILLAVAGFWLINPMEAQGAPTALAAAPVYDQGGALLIGVMGVLYMVRRRRRLRN